MKEQDFQTFGRALQTLGAMYDKELSRPLIELYFSALADMSLEDVLRGIKTLTGTAQFMPKPVEIRNAVIPDVKGQALLAFDRVIKAISEVGTYESVVFDDPAIHAVVEAMGGWTEFGQKQADDPWLRKEFERLYQVYAKADLRGVPRRLIGYLELGNGSRGYKTKPPVLIGDATRIQKWQSQLEAPKGQLDQLVGELAERKALEGPKA